MDQEPDRVPKWPARLTVRELDAAVRAAIADPPTDDERARAGDLIRVTRDVVALDPVRVAAATFGPAPAALPLADQAEKALEEDHEARERALSLAIWAQEYARAMLRLVDARQTDAPDTAASAGVLPSWRPFSPFEPRRELLTPTEAATRLGITPATLRAWSAQGILPTVRLANGRRRYTPAAIEAARERMGAPEEPTPCAAGRPRRC